MSFLSQALLCRHLHKINYKLQAGVLCFLGCDSCLLVVTNFQKNSSLNKICFWVLLYYLSTLLFNFTLVLLALQMQIIKAGKMN